MLSSLGDAAGRATHDLPDDRVSTTAANTEQNRQSPARTELIRQSPSGTRDSGAAESVAADREREGRQRSHSNANADEFEDPLRPRSRSRSAPPPVKKQETDPATWSETSDQSIDTSIISAEVEGRAPPDGNLHRDEDDNTYYEYEEEEGGTEEGEDSYQYHDEALDEMYAIAEGGPTGPAHEITTGPFRRTVRVTSSPWVRQLKPTELRPQIDMETPEQPTLNPTRTHGGIHPLLVQPLTSQGESSLHQRRTGASAVLSGISPTRMANSLTMDAISTFSAPKQPPREELAVPLSPRVGGQSPTKMMRKSSNTTPDERRAAPPEFSFRDFLLFETSIVRRPDGDQETEQESKRQRIYNFLQIPYRLEGLLKFGFMVCVDAFLYVFTFLPLRVILALIALAIKPVAGKYAKYDDKISDIIKGAIVVVICSLLCLMDTSVMYHYIRGQSVLKIYVVYNVLEILEKLCCSFGQDIMDAMLEHNKGSIMTHMALVDFSIACIYVLLHTMVLLLQVLTLNVAVNGSSNALLTLLISNNFVEIKSNVFKKFHIENVFQISCSDMVERFQITIYLIIVIHQNMMHMQWTVGAILQQVVHIFLPVFGVECVIDWIKHGFITKFNQIPPETYHSYAVILYNDVASCRMKHVYADPSYIVSRRVGFVPLPLACLVIRMLLLNKTVGRTAGGAAIIFVFYLCLCVLKVLTTILILGAALHGGRNTTTKEKQYAASNLREVERYEMSKSRIP